MRITSSTVLFICQNKNKMEHIKNRLKGLGLTDSTIRTYTSILRVFFNHTRKVKDFSEQEIVQYLDYLMVTKNYSGRSRNLVSKIIKFYCREFLGFEIKIQKAKENKPIPKVCWDNDFREIIRVTPNIKHRIILQLMRYSGLRRFEAISIMKHNVLLDGRIFIKGGKGQKDRYTITPPQLLDQLNSFINLLPTDNPYIFQGQKGGYYHPKTPNEILKNAFKKLGWHKDKWFGCHALRHAFAVYTLDNKIGELLIEEIETFNLKSLLKQFNSAVWTTCF